MTTYYKSCPNCGGKSQGIFGGWFSIFQCKSCGQVYCYQCGKYHKDCPKCGSSSKKEIGQVTSS